MTVLLFTSLLMPDFLLVAHCDAMGCELIYHQFRLKKYQSGIAFRQSSPACGGWNKNQQKTTTRTDKSLNVNGHL